MSNYRRRDLLRFGTIGLGLRAAITGLPASFLLAGRAHASSTQNRIAILASSSQGEPLNVCGPGTYDPNYTDHFTHPRLEDIDLLEVVEQNINGVQLGADSLTHSTEIMLGLEQVQMASCFAALKPEMLAHLVWFNYRTGANIHPQYKEVLSCYGQVLGESGRGTEQLPAAIAQEMAALLNTTIAEPLVLGEGAFVSRGSSLANYSPTKLKTLAQSVGQALGGMDNFAAMYDKFIDEAYREVLDNGTAQQRRFFDQHALSRLEATDFGNSLGQLLEDIDDDTIHSQLQCAAFVAKLKLAPVILTNIELGGDNHQDAGLLNETNQTLAMLKALDDYWKVIHELGIEDDVFFANLDVFGRNPSSDGNGRSHHGDFVSGLMMGTHLNGGVVGGWTANGSVQATGINSTNGTSADADIDAEETLAAYYRTIMDAAGVPSDKQDLRLPTGSTVESVAV